MSVIGTVTGRYLSVCIIRVDRTSPLTVTGSLTLKKAKYFSKLPHMYFKGFLGLQIPMYWNNKIQIMISISHNCMK